MYLKETVQVRAEIGMRTRSLDMSLERYLKHLQVCFCALVATSDSSIYVSARGTRLSPSEGETPRLATSSR